MTKHQPIDWKALRERLERVSAALESVAAPRPELRTATLKARSRQLAAVAKGEDAARPRLQVLKFVLVPECYAVPCDTVNEVAPLREYAVVPNAPRFVIGVTSLRGRMISILDLRRFFGLPTPGLTDLNRVIVLSHDELEVGLLADQVLGVDGIALDELGEPLPANGSRATFARGIASGGLIVLDVPRLLSPEGLVRKSGTNGARAAEEAR